ncbi:DUF421 domain-containing protein [Halobacillus sp. BBL2006]|uniref:DUF421 domain-containing protein n=1 Tax=Halobacillus sp. BBL2006 TaxID=1543706 RepID=UPI000542814A|nr:DUF421 domain-containing protein [Halobacillus sp. BBL2006]KHE71886.1 hypothetical protein LD39_07440 [Halobacillus sp. BBL2006]
MNWIWKSVLIILVGTIILRVGGRKSISQMTLAQTVIMIAVGSLLIQPVAGENIWMTFGVGAVLVITLIVMEFLQLKFDFMESFLTGRAVPVIVKGQLQEKNLKSLRFTVDQLEMKLRQQNVSSINDVETATLEPNGQVGIEWKENKKAATKEDIEQLRKEIALLKEKLESNLIPQIPSSLEKGNIFAEVENKENQSPPPKHLQ